MGIFDQALAKSTFDDYPPVTFYFKVVFGTELSSDTSFQEVSGITTSIETEPLVEGGNQYAQSLPTKISHPNLVLQRGIASRNSPLMLWCKKTIETDFGLPIVPMPVNVYLMNADDLPVRGWSFFNVYPVKWEVKPFSSTENKLAIEIIELSYLYSTRVI